VGGHRRQSPAKQYDGASDQKKDQSKHPRPEGLLQHLTVNGFEGKGGRASEAAGQDFPNSLLNKMPSSSLNGYEATFSLSRLACGIYLDVASAQATIPFTVSNTPECLADFHRNPQTWWSGFQRESLARKPRLEHWEDSGLVKTLMLAGGL
jgi:hypothetical protein